MKVKVVDHFDRAELARFVTRPSLAFAAKAALWLCWLLVSVLLQAWARGWLLVAGIVSLGLAIAHGVELSHQALHNSGFASKWANTAFGYLAGAPMLVSFGQYRKNHLHHHRHVGTREDSEFFEYGSNGLSAAELIVNLSMVRHYLRYLAQLRLAVVALARRAAGQKLRREPSNWFYPVSCLALCALAAVLLGSGHARLLASLSASLFFVAGPVHYLVELPEHWGCDNGSLSVFENTRSIQTNALISWFVNGNNYHVEHHLLGCAPLEHLAHMHARLAPELRHCEQGYWAFYFKLLSGEYARRPSFSSAPAEDEALTDEP